MEENKRPRATKKAIQNYMASNVSFSDEHIDELVERTYPKLYEDIHYVAVEIIKELFRREVALTDNNFISLLKDKTEAHEFRKHEAAIKELTRNYAKAKDLFNKIYKEAQTKSFLLSQCSGFDDNLKAFIIQTYESEGKNLAQTFYIQLNWIAKSEISPNGYNDLYLQLHCYPQSNDDVLFTPNKQNGYDNYDESGSADFWLQNRQSQKANKLLKRIYKEAHERTTFLSQYKEYTEDKEVQQYFKDICKEKNRTLAQQLYAFLNQMALNEALEMSGFILPFHCYMEPNGDVVFTKNKRNRFDYDENGKPLYSEEEIEKRNNRHKTSSTVQSSSKTGNGCMVLMASIIVIVTAFILF